MINKASEEELSALLQNLSRLQRKSGDYQSAIINLEQAIRYEERLKNNLDPIFDKLYISLAYNYKLLGNYEASIKYSNLAIEIISKDGPASKNKKDLIDAYQNLAETYRLKNHLEEATKYTNEALEIQNCDESYLKEISFQELGEINLLQKEYQTALSHFKTADKILVQKYGEQRRHPKLAFVHQRIGKLHFDSGDLKAATAAYQKALQYLSANFNNDDPVKNPKVQSLLSLREGFPILRAKAQVLFERYKKFGDLLFLQSAFSAQQTLASLIDASRREFKNEASKLYLNSFAHDAFAEGIETALTLYEPQVIKNI